MTNISRTSATFIGLGAVLLWALLALFTVYTGKIPPFQLTFMTFTIAFLFAALKWQIAGDSVRTLFNYPLPMWILGIGGLFGYHFFYFLALKNAPAAEAGLIAYLWPLLIVLFSTFLPGERLHWFHFAGALLSLLGAGLLITKGQSLEIDPAYILGYTAAFLCAFIWSSYSVLSRRFADVPTDVVGIYCAATAVLALICHFIFEETLFPQDLMTWFAVIGLGLGPVGAAFFMWDIGMKKGDIQGLGVLSYLSPLLSTLLLIWLSGNTPFTWALAAGCILITFGAVVGSLNLISAMLKKSG